MPGSSWAYADSLRLDALYFLKIGRGVLNNQPEIEMEERENVL